MAGQKKRNLDLQAQGIELIDLVIERVRADPYCISGFCRDQPLKQARLLPADVLEHLAFPSGKPLPPSLKRWLDFDASWLKESGWFSSLEQGTFTPRRLDEIVAEEFDGPQSEWSEMYAPLSARMGGCFLLPDGTESRRIYAVTEPDALGEYPVIAIDIGQEPPC